MLNVILIALMLVCSAFFSAAETSFSTVNRIRLRNYADSGNKKALRALKIAEKYDKAITAILIGNNLVNIASTAIGTALFTALFSENGIAVATVVMTVLVLVFGEILPKSVAKENAEAFAMAFAAPLYGIMVVLTPLTWLFSKLKGAVSKLTRSQNDIPSVTEDELKYIIDESEEQGVLEEQESNLVKSALEFDEIEVSRILVPRVNVVSVSIDDSIEMIKTTFLNEMYSRLPVYEKTIDNIIGIIHTKDFFRMLESGSEDIRSIIQKPLYISELRPISEILKEMQRTKLHMAIVMDQYGGTMGIVTLEDIIEELVGEIYDENDEVVTMITTLGENTYEVLCDLSVADMLEQLGLPDDAIETESATVGGWVLELFGVIPQKDEAIQSGIFRITVLEQAEQRILKIRLEIDTKEEEQE